MASTTTGSVDAVKEREREKKERKKNKFSAPPLPLFPVPAHTTNITATRTGTKYFHYATMYFTGAYFVRRFCSIWIVNHDFLFPFLVSYVGSFFIFAKWNAVQNISRSRSASNANGSSWTVVIASGARCSQCIYRSRDSTDLFGTTEG